MTVETDDYRRAYETALPELVKRLQAQLAGQPVAVETKKAVKPRRDKPAAKPKPKQPVPPKPPKPPKPATGWAAFAADEQFAETPAEPNRFPGKRIPPPPTRRQPMARKQPDPFDDLEIDGKAPINPAYLGLGRAKREPQERIKVTGAGLIKRTVVKPKPDAEDDIFAGLEIDA